jgi:hypothetical protein
MTCDVVSPRQRDNEPGRQLSPEQAAAAAARRHDLGLVGVGSVVVTPPG